MEVRSWLDRLTTNVLRTDSRLVHQYNGDGLLGRGLGHQQHLDAHLVGQVHN